VERAETILLRSIRKVKREVLAAKLRLARNQRSTQTDEEISRVSNEMAARGAFQSGARIQACWAIALARTKEAADTVITACLELGAPEALIADFVSLDAEQFLSTRSRAFVGEHTQQLASLAGSYAVRARDDSQQMRDVVRARCHDFEEQHGSRLERWLKRLERRPTVKVAALLWGAVAFVYAHVEFIPKAVRWLRGHLGH
jgi:hypothetical protein